MAVGDGINEKTPKRANKTELAQILGVSFNTVSKHLKKPGAPKPGVRDKKYNTQKVLAFVLAEQRKSNDLNGQKTDGELGELMLKEKQLKVDTLEVKLEQMRGNLIGLRDAQTIMEHFVEIFRNEIERIPDVFAAEFKKKEIVDKSRRLSNKILRSVAEQFENSSRELDKAART